MIAWIALISSHSQDLFQQTVSPSGRFGIVHIGTAKGDGNDLVDLKSKRTVARLKGFSGFAGENHGGMNAAYSRNEALAVVMQAGKWEPRALAAIVTSTGAQVDILRSVQSQAAAYVRRHGTKTKAGSFVFDVSGAKFDGDKLMMAVIGQVPKSESDPILTLSATCRLSVGRTLKAPHFKFASLPETQEWGWPQSN